MMLMQRQVTNNGIDWTVPDSSRMLVCNSAHVFMYGEDDRPQDGDRATLELHDSPTGCGRDRRVVFGAYGDGDLFLASIEDQHGYDVPAEAEIGTYIPRATRQSLAGWVEPGRAYWLVVR